MICSFFFNPFFASDVFIETDMEFGRGILRKVGSTCLVYTPRHVIEDTDDIYVSGRFKRDIEVSLLTQYPQDLAVLMIPANAVDICQESSWRDGGDRVSAIINSSKKATLSFRKKNGGMTEYDLDIVQKEIHSYFYVKLSDSKKSIKQGMSGSTVYVSNYPIGMLVSVNDGIGKILRIDEITNISQSVVSKYESELEKVVRNSEMVTPSIKNSNTNSILLNSTSVIQEFKGQIAKGAENEFKILAAGNTAYRLTNVEQKENVSLKLEFLNPGEKKLFGTPSFSTNKKRVFGFGTVDSGEHIVKITGKRGAGTYHLILEVVATPEALVGDTNFLENGDSAKGFISAGTVAYYKILSKGNTAYRLTNVIQSEKVHLGLEFLNPGEKKLFAVNSFNTDRKGVYGFGTVDSGEHILKITGKSGVGTYHLKLDVVATPEELVSDANFLENGDSAKGFISAGTIAFYKILSKGNTAYRLSSVKQSKKVHLGLEFLNPDEKSLFRAASFNTSKKKVLGFGTIESGEHILKITGKRGVGTYHLKLDVVATPEELVGDANFLESGDSAKGFISAGTTAYYKILSQGKTAYRLTSAKQNEKVTLRLEFLNPDGKKLFGKSTFITNKKNVFEFSAKESGEHILRITGKKGVGTYHFKLEESQ